MMAQLWEKTPDDFEQNEAEEGGFGRGAQHRQ